MLQGGRLRHCWTISDSGNIMVDRGLGKTRAQIVSSTRFLKDDKELMVATRKSLGMERKSAESFKVSDAIPN